MQIQNLIAEDFSPEAAAPKPQLRLRDLNSLQRRTLQRLADGVVDVDSASEAEFEIISDLYQLGLLDDEYQVTKAGAKAVEIIKRLHTQEIDAARGRQDARDRFDASKGASVTDVDVPDVGGDTVVPDEDDEFDFSVDTAARPRLAA